MPIPREGFDIKTQVSVPPYVMELGDMKTLALLLATLVDAHVEAHWSQIRTVSREMEKKGFRAILRGPEVLSSDNGVTKMHSTIIPVRAQ